MQPIRLFLTRRSPLKPALHKPITMLLPAQLSQILPILIIHPARHQPGAREEAKVLGFAEGAREKAVEVGGDEGGAIGWGKVVGGGVAVPFFAEAEGRLRGQ